MDFNCRTGMEGVVMAKLNTTLRMVLLGCSLLGLVGYGAMVLLPTLQSDSLLATSPLSLYQVAYPFIFLALGILAGLHLLAGKASRWIGLVAIALAAPVILGMLQSEGLHAVIACYLSIVALMFLAVGQTE